MILFAGVLVVFVVVLYRKLPPFEGGSAPEETMRDVAIVGTTYFISPSGNDAADGRSPETAFVTVQRAMDVLAPGDGVVLADGAYYQDITTVRSGEKEKPIVLKGSRKAILKGSGERDKIIEIHHSFIALVGFTVDGLGGDGRHEKAYRDKLIYAESLEPLSGVTGVRILNMHLLRAGGECLRMKYFAHENEIAYNTIEHCGAYDFIFDGGGKNGEGIYIGTAPEQIAKDKNVTRDTDASFGNHIHDNIIETHGNECIDIKEGSSGNVVERNTCTGQKDPESAGLDSRGTGNIFRENESFGNVGAGIRVGGDKDDDGINTVIENNFLHDNQNGGIKIQRSPQGRICGNRIEKNKRGDFVGEYGEDTRNEKACL
jgi:hypothetical protein